MAVAAGIAVAVVLAVVGAAGLSLGEGRHRSPVHRRRCDGLLLGDGGAKPPRSGMQMLSTSAGLVLGRECLRRCPIARLHRLPGAREEEAGPESPVCLTPA